MEAVPPSSVSGGLLSPSSDVSNGINSISSNQSMNIGETASTMTSAEGQATSATEPEKVWEKPFASMNELKNEHRSTWTLSSDSRLLYYLQVFSKTMISKTHKIEQLVESLHHEVKNCDSKLENSFGEFLMLSNTQFIENRIGDDTEDQATAEKDSKSDTQEKTREQREKEIIPRFKEALSFGLSVLTNAYEQLDTNVDHSDSEDEEGGMKIDPILEAKDLYAHRPLPYLIGSNDFRQDDNIGLGDESSEDISESDHGSISESEEEKEVERNMKDDESSESFSSYESADDSTRPAGQPPRTKPTTETYSSSDNDSSEEELFKSVEENQKKADLSSSESSQEEEISTVKKPVAFTDELSAVIGGGNKTQKTTKPHSEDFDQDSVDAKTEKQRTESKIGDKKKKHQKHKTKKEPEETGPPPKSPSVAPSSSRSKTLEEGSSDDDDDESPFSNRAGLFSSGGKLFDNDEDDDEGGSFDDHPSIVKPAPPPIPQTPSSDEEDDLGFSASVSSARVRGKTESGRFIPVGAVPMFGDQGSPIARKFITPQSSNTKGELSPPSEAQQQKPTPTQKPQSVAKSDSVVTSDRAPPPDDDLFVDDDDDDLFTAPATRKPTVPKQTPTAIIKPKKPPVESTPPPYRSVPPPMPSGGLFGDDEEDELFAGSFSAPKPKPKQQVIPKPQQVTPKPKPKPQQQKPPPSKRVVSLFDDDDEEDGGGLFSFAEKKTPSKSTTVATESDSKPKIEKTAPAESPKFSPQVKAKSTASSLFADLDDEDDDDLFAALTKSKPTKPAPITKKIEVNIEEPRVDKPVKKQSMSMFDDDEVDMDDDQQDGIIPSPQHPKTAEPPLSKQSSTSHPEKKHRHEQPRSLFEDDDLLFGGVVGAEEGPGVDLFSPSSQEKPQPKQTASPTKTNKPFGGVSMFGGVDPFSELKKGSGSNEPPVKHPPVPVSSSVTNTSTTVVTTLLDSNDDDLFAPKKQPPSKPKTVKTAPPTKTTKPVEPQSDPNPFTVARQQLAVKSLEGIEGQSENSFTPQDDDEEDLFAPKKFTRDKNSVPSSPGNSVGKSSRPLSVGLMIDPKSLLPGAVHPKLIEDLSSKAVTFEEPVKSASLQSFTKDRAKVQTKRRPPSRSGRRATTQVTKADLLEADQNFDPLKKRLSLPPEEGVEVDNLPQQAPTEITNTDPVTSGPVQPPPSLPITNTVRDIFGNDDLFGDLDLPGPSKAQDSPVMNKSAAELESDLFGTKSRAVSVFDDDMFPPTTVTTSTTKPTVETKQQSVKIDDDLFKEDESLFVKKKTTRKPPIKTADSDLFSDSTDIFSNIPAPIKKKTSSSSPHKGPSTSKKSTNKTSSPAAGKKMNIFDDDSFDLFASPNTKSKKTTTTKTAASKQTKSSASIFDTDSSDIFDDPLNAKK